jgi:hypothetical protein
MIEEPVGCSHNGLAFERHKHYVTTWTGNRASQVFPVGKWPCFRIRSRLAERAGRIAQHPDSKIAMKADLAGIQCSNLHCGAVELLMDQTDDESVRL